MNIAFWSGVSGKSATSGNMLAVGTFTSIMYSLKTIFLQFDYYSRPIEEIFEGKRNDNVIKDELSYYRKEGLDDIIDYVKLGRITDQVVFDNIKTVKNSNIHYIPTSRKFRNGVDEETSVYLTTKLSKTLEKACDITFIDNQNGNRRLSKKSLYESDVIVINLCQGINDIDHILQDKELRKKAVFVVGKYDDNSKENINFIRKQYNISKDEIGVIPYNIRFHDAIYEGKVYEFIKNSMYSKRNDGNYEFINELYKTTGMILKKAGYHEVK